ncbi:MAG: TerD family protein [Clostridia bacterium]|nr:TerD family protein [Clostridia bacterium]
MSVNLRKGEKVNLRKPEGGGELRRVMVGLGWDEVEQKKTLFFTPKPIDCDASAILCINGKLKGIDDVVYYGNLNHKSGAVAHMGDNITGEGDGDDEQISIDLKTIPSQYDRIVIVVNIYDANARRQHFGLIQNAFVRVFDVDTNKEICKYDLSENYDGMTTVICGELVKEGNEWKFNAVGQANKDPNLQTIISRYR